MNKENMRPKDERYRMFIKNRLPGLVTLLECDICGHLSWSGTATKEPDGYRIEPQSPYGCIKCDEALMRTPEIAKWVVNVVIKAQRDMTPNSVIDG